MLCGVRAEADRVSEPNPHRNLQKWGVENNVPVGINLFYSTSASLVGVKFD